MAENSIERKYYELQERYNTLEKEYSELWKKYCTIQQAWKSQMFLNSLDRKKYYEELEYKERLDNTLIVLKDLI